LPEPRVTRATEFTAIDEAVSTTGKYAIAYGQHFTPEICYDIVALNQVTGIATRLHFRDDKAQAMTRWQDFKQAMTAPRTESEEEEKDVYKIFGPNGKPTRCNPS